MLGFPIGDGDGLRTAPRCLEGLEKFRMINFTMPNKISSMKYAVKSVPGLADVGVPRGDGDGPGPPPRCTGVQKKNKMTNFTMNNKVFYEVCF